MTQRFRFMSFLVPALAAFALLGCASDRTDRRSATPAPGETEFNRARQSIAEAEQVGALEYGAPQLALAREKLRSAEDAAAEGEIEHARRLAVEAGLDANLAVAI